MKVDDVEHGGFRGVEEAGGSRRSSEKDRPRASMILNNQDKQEQNQTQNDASSFPQLVQDIAPSEGEERRTVAKQFRKRDKFLKSV